MEFNDFPPRRSAWSRYRARIAHSGKRFGGSGMWPLAGQVEGVGDLALGSWGDRDSAGLCALKLRPGDDSAPAASGRGSFGSTKTRCANGCGPECFVPPGRRIMEVCGSESGFPPRPRRVRPRGRLQRTRVYTAGNTSPSATIPTRTGQTATHSANTCTFGTVVVVGFLRLPHGLGRWNTALPASFAKVSIAVLMPRNDCLHKLFEAHRATHRRLQWGVGIFRPGFPRFACRSLSCLGGYRSGVVLQSVPSRLAVWRTGAEQVLDAACCTPSCSRPAPE